MKVYVVPEKIIVLLIKKKHVLGWHTVPLSVLLPDWNIEYSCLEGDFQFPVQHVRGLEILLPSMQKKLNKLEIKTLLRSIREWKLQGILLFPKLERQSSRLRESQITGTKAHEQNPPWETVKVGKTKR